MPARASRSCEELAPLLAVHTTNGLLAPSFKVSMGRAQAGLPRRAPAEASRHRPAARSAAPAWSPRPYPRPLSRLSGPTRTARRREPSHA
ncbi:unnamed protein product, partial [Prorocentrum cordatum]